MASGLLCSKEGDNSQYRMLLRFKIFSTVVPLRSNIGTARDPIICPTEDGGDYVYSSDGVEVVRSRAGVAIEYAVRHYSVSGYNIHGTMSTNLFINGMRYELLLSLVAPSVVKNTRAS